jgi:hypothetical protein
MLRVLKQLLCKLSAFDVEVALGKPGGLAALHTTVDREGC